MEHSDVREGESVSVTCSVMCTASQTPTLTLYKNPFSREVIGRRYMYSGQTVSFSVSRDDNDVAFYCGIDNWSNNLRSRELRFDIQCKLSLKNVANSTLLFILFLAQHWWSRYCTNQYFCVVINEHILQIMRFIGFDFRST